MKIVKKVWGIEKWIINTKKYCGKILKLKKNYRSSKHCHKIKDETFYILSGKVLFELNDKSMVLSSGDIVRIKPKNWHRFTGLENSTIIEFSTHHKQSDTYRTDLSGKIEC